MPNRNEVEVGQLFIWPTGCDFPVYRKGIREDTEQPDEYVATFDSRGDAEEYCRWKNGGDQLIRHLLDGMQKVDAMLGSLGIADQRAVRWELMGYSKLAREALGLPELEDDDAK